MTREKELEKAAYEYSEINLDTSAEYGFISGAKWADNNPILPWISVEDDLPSNHEDMHQMSGSLLYTDDVLVLAGNMVLVSRRLVTCMMFDDSTGKWKWNTPFHVKHWMRIPKLEEE